MATQGGSNLQLFLLRLAAGSVLLGYLYLEGSATYQMCAIAISMLIWLGSYYRRSATLLFLYSVFLLCTAGMYALKYNLSPFYCSLIVAVSLVALRYLLPHKWLSFRRHAVISLIITEGVLLGSYLPLGTFVFAAILTFLGTFDMFIQASQLKGRWRILSNYGIVALLAVATSHLHL